MTILEAWGPYTVAAAPMAGVTDKAFRAVCRSFGRVYTVSEMVSAKALCQDDRKTAALLALGPDEHPAAVQIFGSEPDSMAEGARRAIELSGADVLDVNMGCPTPKIVKNGDGSALMRDIDRAEAVVRAVCRAVDVPVTVKTRLGWDGGALNAAELAERLKAAGAAGFCIHGRTRAQMYAGKADWDAIAKVIKAVAAPFMANGDVFTPRDAVRCRELTGASMVMTGRAILGRPWLPAQMDAALRGNPIPPAPAPEERLGIAHRQYKLMLETKGERVATLEMRKHLAWYLRGWRGNNLWRPKIMEIKTAGDVERTIDKLKNWAVREQVVVED